MIAVDALPAPGTAAYRSLVMRAPVPEEVRVQTRALLLDVQQRGDAALLELTERFDGVRLQRTAVSSESIRAALDNLDPGLRQALEVAASNIEAVHAAQRFQEEPVDVPCGASGSMCRAGGRSTRRPCSCSPSRPASPAAGRS